MSAPLKVQTEAKDDSTLTVNYNTFFMNNGAKLLEELVAFCNGKSYPIRNFSEEELKIATNNYCEAQCFLLNTSISFYNPISDISAKELDLLEPNLDEDQGDKYYFKLYKGFLQDSPVSVKKYTNLRRFQLRNFWGIDYVNKIFRDIAIGSQMSVHNNVLKLVGCCLETIDPIAVYEFVGTRSLSDCLSYTNHQPLPWSCRLKIAMDLANAVAYMHNAFATPVSHGNIESSNIILDDDNVPKLIGFTLSEPIRKPQSSADDVSLKFLLYLDVSNFGKLLLELLSGERQSKPNAILRQRVQLCLHHNELGGVIDGRIGIEQQKLLDFTRLILKCMSVPDRLTMIEVGRELRRIALLFSSPS